MLPELVQKVSLFRLLHRIDVDLARECRQKGCPYCGGPLHQANYERKPRGGPDCIPEDYLIRQSLCCGREGCRRRVLPPSCLFMGRRVYWGCVILVVMALRQQRVEGFSAGKLQRMFAIPRNTLMRWFAYFREEFASTEKWQRLRGRVSARVKDSRLPGALVEHFVDHCESARSGLVACLRFLA